MRKPDHEHWIKAGNFQRLYKFSNGYGASVIRGPFTAGGMSGKWELAVLGKDGRITHDTPITDDVIGFLTEKGVDEVLDRIEALEG